MMILYQHGGGGPRIDYLMAPANYPDYGWNPFYQWSNMLHIRNVYVYTSRAGHAGGGSFKTEKNNTPKKKIAKGDQPVHAMPKPKFFEMSSTLGGANY